MDPDTMTVLAWYPEEGRARDLARQLVGQGIGATVEPGPDPGAAPTWGVAVLAADQTRAREVLGLPEPARTDGVGEGDELRSGARQLWLPVLLAVGALVLVPLVAFFVSFKLSGG
jgi:hypothetical protein